MNVREVLSFVRLAVSSPGWANATSSETESTDVAPFCSVIAGSTLSVLLNASGVSVSEVGSPEEVVLVSDIEIVD